MSLTQLTTPLKKLFKPHSLRQKIFLANLLIVMGAFLLFGALLIYLLCRNAITQNLTISRTAFEHIKYFVTEKTAELKRTVNTVALDPEVTSMLTRSNEELNAENWYLLYTDLRKICLSNTAVSDLQDLFIVTDSALASYYQNAFLLPYSSLADTTWSAEINSFTGNSFFQRADVLGDQAQKSNSYILITFPFFFHYNDQNTFFLGYLDANVLKELLLADADNVYTSYFLLNTEGNILAGNAFQDTSILPDLLGMLDLTRSQSLQKQFQGRTWYLDSVPINNTNLVLVSIQEYDRMAADILLQNIRSMLLILLVILPFVAATSYYITRSLTRRLDALKEHMLQASKGDFDMEILSVKNADEVSLLNQHFNYMATKISLLLDEKLAIGKRLKEQELIALQAQINPHFLYNTLDLIKWKAVKHHDDEIEALVNSLSDYYRLALSKGKEYVPLRAELSHIEAYLYIQNQRFDGQISLSLQIPDDCMDYLLPKLTLQPIVENAILHGILETEEQSGHICIECQRKEAHMLLSIQDDGVGMDPVRAESLFDHAPGETVLSSGYGLYNIRERIRLIYGPQWNLTIDSSPGKGTSVTLILPATCPLR